MQSETPETRDTVNVLCVKVLSVRQVPEIKSAKLVSPDAGYLFPPHSPFTKTWVFNQFKHLAVINLKNKFVMVSNPTFSQFCRLSLTLEFQNFL